MAPVAHKIGPTVLDRLVEEAIARFMPETAEETRRRAADGRHFTIEHDQVSFAGTSLVHGELDLADALDLDQAIRGIADQLKDPRLHRVPRRTPLGRGRRPRSPPARPGPAARRRRDPQD